MKKLSGILLRRRSLLKKTLLTMKLMILLFTVSLINLSASVYSQSTKFTFDVKSVSVKEVLKMVESQSKFRFLYNDEFRGLERVVTLSTTDSKIEEILNLILKNQDLTYKVFDNNLIIITPTDLLSNQTSTITGTVSDAMTGEPVIGANIIIEGTTIGTTSDVSGKFSIEVPGVKSVLIISFIGYNSEKVRYEGQSFLDIKLMPDITKLEEIVVIGYGTMQKGNVTGAVSKVSGKDITAMAVTSFDQALQGRVAGITVTNNGSPGTSPIVRIRGIGSINFNSDPLYVVDGIPTSSIRSVDPKDIESMDVLKDASASAIYGSRGANGVIIVTTKKGSMNDKFSIEYDGYRGVQKAWKQLELLNRDEYLRYGKDLLQNAGLALPARWSNLNNPIYEGAEKTFADTDTDWQKAMFRSAPITQHNLSISGGNAKSRFYTSAGYFSQDGIMIGTDYRRLNFRLNSTHEIGRRLNFGETFSISSDVNQGEKQVESRPQIMHMIRAVPYMPVTDPTIDGGYRGPDGVDGTDYQNPVRIALQRNSKYYTFKMIGNAFAELKITNWLKYKSVVGLEYGSDRQFSVNPTFYAGTYHSSVKEQMSDFRMSSSTWLFTNQLTADRTFGQHNINAIAVAEQQDNTYYTLSGGGTLPDNSIQQLANPNDLTLNGSKGRDILISYLGRVQYSFANKYLLSTSFRADGSSKFAPGKKWGYFKSFSAGWRISEEEFMKSIAMISDLKLRASYGETGFNGIGNYVWQSTLSAGGAYYMLNDVKSSASYFNRLGNRDLQWETTNMVNVGFDIKLFENALYFSAEIYNRKTDNMILSIDLAPSMGYAVGTNTNIGSMSNKGFEVQLGYQKKVGEFSFNVSGNLSANRNKVEKLNLPTAEIYSGGAADFGGDAITRTKQGEPIQQFYGYKVDGIFQNQAEIDAANALDNDASTLYQGNAKPGDIRFKDLSGPAGVPDGKIDAFDRTVIGSYLPDFIYGFNLSLEYKGFDLSAYLQGSQGNEIFNANRVTLEGMARLFNAGKQVLNAWTPSNTNTNIPRAVSGDPNKNARVSDRWIEDGSYLRVQNVTIGYTLPKEMLSNLTRGAFKGLRVYVSGQNLFTFTKYSGYDPEIGKRQVVGSSDTWGILSNGIDYGQYPQPRTLLGGIQVKF